MFKWIYCKIHKSTRDLTVDQVLCLIHQLQVYARYDLEPILRQNTVEIDKALSVLKGILTKTDPVILQDYISFCKIIDCTLIVFHHLLTQESVYSLYSDRRLRKTETLFSDLLNLLCPEKSLEVVIIVMRYLAREHLWEIRYFSSRTLALLTTSGIRPGLIVHEILKYIKFALKLDVQQAKEIFEVFMEVLYLSDLRGITAVDLTEMIRLYHSSLAELDSPISPLVVCFEVCLKKIFEVMEFQELVQNLMQMIPLSLDTNLKGISQIKFVNMIFYIINCFDGTHRSTRLESFTIIYLLEGMMVGGERRSYFACKILSRILDDGKNYNLFKVPQLFHFYTNYDVHTHCLDPQKYGLYLKYRDLFDTAILVSIQRHGSNQKNLQAVYSLLCQIVQKTPSNMSASDVICLIMRIQQYTVKSKLDQRVSNQIHATIMALMSLFSWLHRGKILHHYVDKIKETRNFKSPHLLPPLKVMN